MDRMAIICWKIATMPLGIILARNDKMTAYDMIPIEVIPVRQRMQLSPGEMRTADRGRTFRWQSNLQGSKTPFARIGSSRCNATTWNLTRAVTDQGRIRQSGMAIFLLLMTAHLIKKA